MTVVLTGDVHQWIDSADRAFADETELALALDYARIAGRHGLKVTLFLTGRAALLDHAGVRMLLELDEGNVEIGGHGWDAFRPAWRYRLLTRVLGSPHGSAAMQARMVDRTCRAIERVTTERVSSWRNHAYRFDDRTGRVLSDAGIRVWSDEVDGALPGPYRHDCGVAVLPINTMPDHEHVFHGAQTVETVPAAKRRQYNHPRVWRKRVVEQVESIVAQGGVATILAHPLCMKVMDDWQTFEALCASLSRYSSAWATEAVAQSMAPGDGHRSGGD